MLSKNIPRYPTSRTLLASVISSKQKTVKSAKSVPKKSEIRAKKEKSVILNNANKPSLTP